MEHWLPHDLLLHIFKRIEADLVSRVAVSGVCRSWRQASRRIGTLVQGRQECKKHKRCDCMKDAIAAIVRNSTELTKLQTKDLGLHEIQLSHVESLDLKFGINTNYTINRCVPKDGVLTLHSLRHLSLKYVETASKMKFVLENLKSLSLKVIKSADIEMVAPNLKKLELTGAVHLEIVGSHCLEHIMLRVCRQMFPEFTSKGFPNEKWTDVVQYSDFGELKAEFRALETLRHVQFDTLDLGRYTRYDVKVISTKLESACFHGRQNIQIAAPNLKHLNIADSVQITESNWNLENLTIYKSVVVDSTAIRRRYPDQIGDSMIIGDVRTQSLEILHSMDIMEHVEEMQDIVKDVRKLVLFRCIDTDRTVYDYPNQPLSLLQLFKYCTKLEELEVNTAFVNNIRLDEDLEVLGPHLKCITIRDCEEPSQEHLQRLETMANVLHTKESLRRPLEIQRWSKADIWISEETSVFGDATINWEAFVRHINWKRWKPDPEP